MAQSTSGQTAGNLSFGSAATILLIFLLIGGLGFWARGMAVAVPGPGIIKTTPSGDVLVQVGTDLLRVTSQGADVQTYNLASLGVARLFDFVPLGDNKILVRVGPYHKDLAQNIAMFLRRQDTSALPPAGAGHGLQDCDLGTMSCVPFAHSFDIDDVHWLARDPATGDVYVADTSRSRLYKFNANGAMIAKKTTGFIFPNQITVVGKALRVVDTNHQVVKLVDTQSASFGKLLRNETHVPDSVEKFDMRSSPVMEADVGTEHWLLVMNDSMENGAVYRYTADWTPLGSVMPPNTEAEYVAPVGVGAWISDGKGRRVLEFDEQGNETGQLQSPKFNQRMTALGKQESLWMEVEYSMAGLFLMSLVGGIALGARQGASDRRAAYTIQDQPVVVDVNDRAIYWMGIGQRTQMKSGLTKRRFLLLPFASLGITWAMLVAATYAVPGPTGGSHSFRFRAIFVTCGLMILAVAGWIGSKFRCRIGILGDVLVLRRGKEYRAARGKNIIYSGRSVAIDGFIAPLFSMSAYGTPKKIYSTNEIITHFNPVIQKATVVTPAEMSLYGLRYVSKKTWTLLIVGVLCAIAAIIFLKRAS